MSWEYNEDNLVEQATCDIFKELGWQIETAWHNETFGINGLLGRENKSEIILSKFLLPVLEKLNPNHAFGSLFKKMVYSPKSFNIEIDNILNLLISKSF